MPPSHHSSSGFYQLHNRVQRWIWQQNWTELRDIQEQAIAPILSGKLDVIISAATAGGKTEAAFLPIFSQLVSSTPSRSLNVLYISPLKALINDQYRRLSELGELLEISICPWHGDIEAGRKQKILQQPSGIVLITPESLEALFVRQGYRLKETLHALSYIVIDELHSFIGNERGKQLQSLLHRVELVIDRMIPRIGLSATLGDMALASDFLRPGQGQSVCSIHSSDDEQELKIQVRGYNVKTKQPVQIDPEVAKSSDDFVNLVVTPARLEQGVTEVGCNQFEMAKIGAFLQWFTADVQKESAAELEAAQLTWKDVNKAVMNAAKKWYQEKSKSL